MFWEALEELLRWERQHLPGADIRHATALLIWLQKANASPKSVSDLYSSSWFSEPTMRACLQAFVRAGLVVMESDPIDPRRRLARGTSRLEQTVEEYQDYLLKLARLIPRKKKRRSSRG
jgi:DNA-binding IclR family transcriptional regulator